MLIFIILVESAVLYLVIFNRNRINIGLSKWLKENKPFVAMLALLIISFLVIDIILLFPENTSIIDILINYFGTVFALFL